MERCASELPSLKIGTFQFNFPYAGNIRNRFIPTEWYCNSFVSFYFILMVWLHVASQCIRSSARFDTLLRAWQSARTSRISQTCNCLPNLLSTPAFPTVNRYAHLNGHSSVNNWLVCLCYPTSTLLTETLPSISVLSWVCWWLRYLINQSIKVFMA